MTARNGSKAMTTKMGFTAAIAFAAALMFFGALTAVSTDSANPGPVVAGDRQAGSDALVEEHEGDFGVEKMAGPWVALREAVGFTGLDKAGVLKLAQSKEGERSIDEFGMPLTSEEQAQMANRVEIRSQASAAAQTLAAEDDTFAGVIGHADGSVEFAFTRRLGKAETDELLAPFAGSSLVSVLQDPAAMTEAELQELALDLSEEAGGKASVILGDFVTGELTLELPAGHGLDAANVNRLERMKGVTVALVDREARVSACTYRWNCHEPDQRGGTKIIPVTGGGLTCTTGFVAQAFGNPNIHYMITARHCGSGGSIGQRFKIGNYDHAIQYTQVVSTTQDAQAVRILPGKSSARFFRNSATKFRPINSEEGASLADGDVVCAHAWKIGRICGGVTDYYIPQINPTDAAGNVYTSNNAFVFRVRLPGEWDCSGEDSAPNQVAGASGGLVASPYSNAAYGILSACANVSYFSWLDETEVDLFAAKSHNIENALGVVMRLE